MRGASRGYGVFLLITLSFGLTLPVFAQQPVVVINEVAWMGTQADFDDEWIELYNTTDQPIDLTGWTLVAADGTPNITFPTTRGCSNLIIPPKGFFLLERTDNNTVSDIAADCIYTGVLGNGGEELTLKDAAGTVIDTANDDSNPATTNGGGWPAGDNTTKSTMERIDPTQPDSDSNWCTNTGVIRNGLDADVNPINGTPKAQNSCDTNAPSVSNKSANPNPFSPNGDGVKDTTTISFDVTEDKSFPVSWKVEIKDSSGNLKRTLTGSLSANGTVNVVWDGKDAGKAVVTDGDYTANFSATDAAGNTGTDPITITVDTTPPPAATLISPANGTATNDNTPSFNWSDVTDPSGVTYTIQVDNNADFSSPEISQSGLTASAFTPATALVDGTYNWRVQAVDGAGNVGAFSSAFTFFLDTVPPAAPTLLAPENGKAINDNTPTFDWSDASDPAPSSGVIYDLLVDNNPDFSSPEINQVGLAVSTFTPTTPLADGTYSWKVKSRDNAGNDPFSSTFTFTVTTTIPDTTITSAVDGNGKAVPNGGATISTSMTFEFTATKAGSTFECQLDAGAFESCTSPKTYTSLAIAGHTFQVRATDPAGNTDPTPASFSWTIAVKGGVDGDGDVDLFDIIKIARFLIGLETFTPAQLAACDVDGDSDCDLADIIRIADYLVGNIAALAKAVHKFASSHVDTAKIQLESKTIPPGDEVSLKLSATPGLAGIQVGPEGSLRFDPAVIHVSAVRGVSPYQVLASKIDNEGGEVKFVAAALGEETKDRLQVHKLASSHVPLVELQVRGVGRAGQGSPLMLNLDDAINRQGQKLKVEIEPGWVVLGEAVALQVKALKLVPNPIRRSHQAMKFIVEGAGIKSVEVEIFNLAGRRVFASGEVLGNTFEWRLRNDHGKVLANGVYLYVVTVRGFDGQLIRSQVRKFVVLK